MTELRTYGRNFNAEIEIYGECKYTASKEVFENSKRVAYNDIEKWEIVTGGIEAKEIEDSGLVDEYHEYLILYFADGDTATFRNSYVDMFRTGWTE